MHRKGGVSGKTGIVAYGIGAQASAVSDHPAPRWRDGGRRALAKFPHSS